MANPDLTKSDERRNVIDAIELEENITRKRFGQRQFDCYRDRQDRYIQEKLKQEFDLDSVTEMRQINSINLTKRIVDAESSVYDREPERMFSGASDNELDQINNLYHYSKANSKYKIANRYYNLQDQGTIYVIPQNGYVQLRPLPTHAFDVIPDCDDPEKAYAYILNTWDLDLRNSYQRQNVTSEQQRYKLNDNMNSTIADDSDRQKAMKRLIVWTPEITYTMDGHGEIKGEILENPIKRLPFIDFALEKDNQFFVRRGSSTTQFAIDMGVILSDIATTNRNQSFGQGVVTSETQPKMVKTNHNKWLWLPMNPDRPELKPSLDFVNPNADVMSGLELVKVLINMFLSSKGLDTSVISGDAQINSASSGIEFLLRMIDKFQASQDDFDIFRWVEWQAYTLMRDWSNVSQEFNEGPLALKDDLKIATISDSVDFDIKFAGPEAIKSDKEKLDEIERKLDLGLISQKMAVMEFHEVEEDKAEEIMQEVNGGMDGQDQEAEGDEIGTEPDDQS